MVHGALAMVHAALAHCSQPTAAAVTAVGGKALHHNQSGGSGKVLVAQYSVLGVEMSCKSVFDTTSQPHSPGCNCNTTQHGIVPPMPSLLSASLHLAHPCATRNIQPASHLGPAQARDGPEGGAGAV